MTLRDLMAAHMPVLLSTEHLGQDVSITTKGASPKTFALRVVMGDQADGYALQSGDVANSNKAQVVFQRTVWRTAYGSGVRDPVRGDTLTIAATLPFEGLWIFTEVTNDEGDACTVQLARPEHHQLAGSGAVELT